MTYEERAFKCGYLIKSGFGLGVRWITPFGIYIRKGNALRFLKAGGIKMERKYNFFEKLVWKDFHFMPETFFSKLRKVQNET